jgi:metallo-beta-lactamase class B
MPEERMKNSTVTLILGCFIALGLGLCPLIAQDSAEAHRAAARAAAGTDHPGLLAALCPAPPAPGAASARGRGAPAPISGNQASAAPARGQTPGAAAPRPAPPREQWHAEPVKVFDNLYWLGQTEYSVWAVTTSAGIIVIDTIFDYSVEDEVVGGMKRLGLDPASIKYVLVSHGHGDHSGGAKFLQDHFHPRVLLSEKDWELLDRSSGTRPARDMIVTDGQKLTLGDTTLTMYITPGHTEGTVSTLIPVKDRGTPHIVAEWGGTLIGGLRTTEGFQTYIDSAERFRDIVTKAGADVIISNHTIYDESKTKLPRVLSRKAGDPNPYLVGTDAVRRYLTVAAECAKAGQAQLKAENRQ